MNEKVRAQTVTRWPIWVVGALLVLFGPVSYTHLTLPTIYSV